MKHLFILLSTVAVYATSSAQINAYYTISSMGSFTSVAGKGSQSTTVGEMAMIQTFSAGGHIITQGFQQGSMLKNFGGGTLPVTLVNFDGENRGSYNHLIWETASEIDNAGFEVQRLNAANEYDVIGFVKGNGTTNSFHEYTFDDKQPFTGENYYRLKQIDVDGKYVYTDIVSVYFGESIETDLSVFPMPVTCMLNVTIHNGESTTGNMTISNILGDTLYEGSIDIEKGATTASIDMRSYAPGEYFLRLRTNSSTKTMHIVRQ